MEQVTWDKELIRYLVESAWDGVCLGGEEMGGAVFGRRTGRLKHQTWLKTGV